LLTFGLLTGSVYAMVGIANRLSARDYVDESQAAPRTGTVQPVTQTTAQHTSNVATGVQSADHTPIEYTISRGNSEVEQSAREEALTKQMNQMEALSNFRSVAVSELRGTDIANRQALASSLS